MTTLLDIRFIVEQNVKDTIENIDIINWSNDAQSNFGLAINIPATTQIAINTTNLKYALPTDLKQINRLWLQSDYDNGMDREFPGPYRIYNGFMIFPRAYTQTDTLNIDYYKNMKYFMNIDDTIDIDDMFTPLYTSYARMRYYQQPQVKQNLGQLAEINAQTYSGMYENTKRDVIAYYSLKNSPIVISERW